MLALALTCLAAPASAGTITVEVRDMAGQPVRDAVVMIHPVGAVRAAAPVKVAWPLVMAQQNISFQPYVLVAPVGSTVSFPNRDKVRHHVYSFSPAKTFELKLYGRDESRSVTFDKPGVVALGCNIHDSMIGYIYVVDTPYVAKTGGDGLAVVRDAPAGPATLTTWHPDLKGRKPVSRAFAVTAADQVATAGLDLRPALSRLAKPD